MLLKDVRPLLNISKRYFAEACGEGNTKKGIVFGAYDGCNPGELRLTEQAMKFDEEIGGKLTHHLRGGGGIKLGTAQVFSNISRDFHYVAVSGLGKPNLGYNNQEIIDECKENIRICAGVGARALQDNDANAIWVEGFTNTEAAAEGAALAVWKFQEYKNKDDQTNNVKVDLYNHGDRDGWLRGMLKAESQNIARRLSETPSNTMTPTIFAQRAIDILCPCGVQVSVRDKDWIETKKMNAFLTVAKGSCEAPLFLEMGYCAGNTEDKPVVLTGKGITFDTGGLCLKPCENMSQFRADMSSAAVLVAVMKTIASMSLPINVNALVPLCENMIGGLGMKPGDVVKSLNGKSIRIENTDHDGRMILTDVLTYAQNYKPCLIMNVATLTRGIKKALGFSATGVFTTSDIVWRELNRAGSESGDRVWRFPFWKHYKRLVTNYIGVDVNNVGKGHGAPCLGASFLMEFVPPGIDFAHLDITGTGMVSPGIGFPYLREGLMSGRPTRTIAQFLYQMACPHEKGDEC